MADPTTRTSTPPASTRIAQPSASSALVAPIYDDTAFPAIAFIGQLAINDTTKSLSYFDANGGWQGVTAASNIQSFYGPTAPSIGVNVGDRWYNTSTGLWNLWTGTAWLPGNASFSLTAPTTPAVGDAWYNLGNGEVRYWDGTGWVLRTDPTAPGVYTGSIPAAANAGSVWTDAAGIVRRCITTYSSSPSMTYWVQLVLAADPLAALIPLSGVRIDAGEATAPPTPTPSTTITITTGLVWKDTQALSTELGSFFVYTGSAWVKVTSQATLATCNAMSPQPSSAPGASPAFTVKGLTTSFVISTADIAATSQIEYHASATSGFTPGPTTLYTSTRSQVYQAKTLPDGTPFSANTDYFFTVIAKNSLGAAAAAAQASAQLALIDTGQVDEIAIDKITAGNLTAVVALLGQLQVGQITLDPNSGLQIPLSNGGLISLPADGSAAQFLKVVLQATQLLVEDNFELRGVVNRIAGTLNLVSSVGAPTTGPTVASTYADPSINLHITDGTHRGQGLTDDGTRWISIHQAGFPPTTTVDAWNKSTGAYTNPATNIPLDGFTCITKNGTDFYLLGASGGVQVVRKYDSTWTFQSQFNAPTPAGYGAMRSIASDGSNLYFAANSTTVGGGLGIGVFSTTLTGGSVTTVCTSAAAVIDLNTVGSWLWVGSADFGAQRFVLGNTSSTHAYVLPAGAGVARSTTQEWDSLSPGVNVLGVWWDGSNFYQFSPANIWKLSPVVTSTARSVRHSWYDSDATGGTHESAWGPTTGYTQLPRTWMSVLTPAPADLGGTDDPNSVRHYIQNGGAGSYYRQADVTASPWTGLYGTPSTAGATAVSTPDFSGVSNPGIVQSTATDGLGALIGLYGDGHGRVGPLSWTAANPTGIWTSYTPTWAGATTNPTLGNGTITGRYFMVGKTCVFRILVTMGSTTSFGLGQYSLTLPFTSATLTSDVQLVIAEATIGGGAAYGRGRIASAATTILLYCAPTTAGGFDRSMTNLTPGTFASGSQIHVSGAYEVA